VAAWEALGLEVEVQAVPPEGQMPGPSYNAIGRLRGGGEGLGLLFDGHLDHNPVCEGWTRDPFGGTVKAGWLYGFVVVRVLPEGVRRTRGGRPK